MPHAETRKKKREIEEKKSKKKKKKQNKKYIVHSVFWVPSRPSSILMSGPAPTSIPRWSRQNSQERAPPRPWACTWLDKSRPASVAATSGEDKAWGQNNSAQMHAASFPRATRVGACADRPSRCRMPVVLV
ncbi:putative cytochrome c [Clavispora lusitaniae]|uniref:Cytochrome c n=1 Tax=Clavispora lusitaniae TaxID=36911 RepID=A0ACD0WJW4_CLALS|nr:putative cytochrome c [Clavispora lusitaniae]QFZ33340.1 putative cytochrome c [Clavispora lusitaniae]QFZ39011.1 putative cytochrome c [Clavispora lusitaniae]QFZ44693.1 putative cytochrome c [Clavispora lusitaniae]QFZ50370.1 putative cytochrome c [Clavispora lusitaniae]